MIKIPPHQLSDVALINMIDEFITRDSTVTDGTLEQKRQRILTLLEKGKAHITYDTDTESAHIWTTEELRRRPKSSAVYEPKDCQNT